MCKQLCSLACMMPLAPCLLSADAHLVLRALTSPRHQVHGLRQQHGVHGHERYSCQSASLRPHSHTALVAADRLCLVGTAADDCLSGGGQSGRLQLWSFSILLPGTAARLLLCPQGPPYGCSPAQASCSWLAYSPQLPQQALRPQSVLLTGRARLVSPLVLLTVWCSSCRHALQLVLG